MKNFFQFLSEATQSQAAMQAKKLGLTGDGHGGWVDRAGKVVARTDKGKLKFIDGRQAKGQEEPSTEKLDENILRQLKSESKRLLKEQLKQEIEKRKRNILIESIKRKLI